MSNATDDHQTWFASGLKLASGGKVYIPSDIVDQGDIEEGDVLNIRVLPAEGDDDTEEIICTDLIFRKDGYVTIPSFKRTVYGLEPTTTIHVDIQTTSKHVNLSDE